MDPVNIHEAKTHLSRLVALERPRRVRFGMLKGKIRYPDDFDTLLRAPLLALFEGRRRK
ncbi:MAG: hypothetical protein ACT4P4_28170 [Betaproteobacteria bacterium]